jgi:hypothetical protein
VLLSTFCFVELALLISTSVGFLMNGVPSPDGKLMALRLDVL